MKIIRDLINTNRPHFNKGGRFQRWYPLFEALESFLYASGKVTATAPHVRDTMDMKRVMITVIVALVPCIVMAMWNTGYQANSVLTSLGGALPDGWRGSILALAGASPQSHISNLLHGALYFLPVLLVCLIVGGIWETIFNVVRGHEMSEAFLVTAVLFALSLPPSIPLWQTAIGISFGVVFAKAAFGGTGRNFMNPALAARVFIFFAYPAQMSGDTVWTAVDGVSSATALAQLAASTRPLVEVLDLSWSQAFIGVMPGSFGETSTLACLLGAGLLLITGIASWRIMAAMLGGGLICSLLFLLTGNGSTVIFNMPPHWHLVLGGFAFGLVFMATDPVSAAHTPVGQWCYGIFIGALAILIRVANPAFPEGTMLAILLGNVFAPLFDYFVVEANIRRRVARHGT